MNTLNNLDDILDYYGKKDPKYFYEDSSLNVKGIDYNYYIKMRFKDINNLHIRKTFTVDGWYVLWYLLANSIKTQYIEISLQQLEDETKINCEKLKEILLNLQKIQSLKIKQKKYNKNTRLCIAIAYNNDDCNIKYCIDKDNIAKEENSNRNGYRAVPVGYIKAILPTISSKEWAILSVLMVTYSYYVIEQIVSPETGEYMHVLKTNNYSFQKQSDITSKTGIAKKTLNKYCEKLEQNQYNLLKVKKGDKYNIKVEGSKNKVTTEVHKYKIPLLERFEYIYHHIYSVEEPNTIERKEVKKQIKKRGFYDIATSNDHKILLLKDYIGFKYKKEMDLFELIQERREKDMYEKMVKSIPDND